MVEGVGGGGGIGVWCLGVVFGGGISNLPLELPYINYNPPHTHTHTHTHIIPSLYKRLPV